MSELLPEAHVPKAVQLIIPPEIDLSNFDYRSIRRQFTPFNVPAVGHGVTFFAAHVLRGRHQAMLPADTPTHVHVHSGGDPKDWRIILNLDPYNALPFRYLDGMCDADNGFTFSDAPGGHYVESHPEDVGLEQKEAAPFDGETAHGIAFKASEVAHSGCAAEILGNRAIIFAQAATLPEAEDHYRGGLTLLELYPFTGFPEAR